MKATQKEDIREKVRFQMLLMLSKVDEDSSTPVSHYVDEVMSLLDTYAEAVRKEMLQTDFPTAWKVMAETNPEHHHELCSYRQTNRAVLCDCAAEKVFIETVRLLQSQKKGQTE